MKMDDVLDGLASDQDAVSSVFLGAVGDGPDLHCIFLPYNNTEVLGCFFVFKYVQNDELLQEI